MRQDWEAGAEGFEITAGRVVELVWLGASPAVLFKQSRQTGRPSGPRDQTLRSSSSSTFPGRKKISPRLHSHSSQLAAPSLHKRERQKENRGLRKDTSLGMMESESLLRSCQGARDLDSQAQKLINCAVHDNNSGDNLAVQPWMTAVRLHRRFTARPDSLRSFGQASSWILTKIAAV